MSLDRLGAYNPFAAGAGLNTSWGKQAFGGENKQQETSIFGGTTPTGINGISAGAEAARVSTQVPISSISPTAKYDKHDTYRHPEMKDEFRCQNLDFLG